MKLKKNIFRFKKAHKKDMKQKVLISQKIFGRITTKRKTNFLKANYTHFSAL